MIKFKFLEFLALSYRIPGKVENAVYCLEISALVPEIFKFEKCTKYANKRSDHVMPHSTQKNINYINRAISFNLRQKPLKLGRLIVLQVTHQNILKGRKLDLIDLYVCWIMPLRHHWQYQNRTPKVSSKAFNIREVWNPVSCHDNEFVEHN